MNVLSVHRGDIQLNMDPKPGSDTEFSTPAVHEIKLCQRCKNTNRSKMRNERIKIKHVCKIINSGHDNFIMAVQRLDPVPGILKYFRWCITE